MGPVIMSIAGKRDLVIAFLNDSVESVTKEYNSPSVLFERILSSLRRSSTTLAVALPESTRLIPSPKTSWMIFHNIG